MHVVEPNRRTTTLEVTLSLTGKHGANGKHNRLHGIFLAPISGHYRLFSGVVERFVPLMSGIVTNFPQRKGSRTSGRKKSSPETGFSQEALYHREEGETHVMCQYESLGVLAQAWSLGLGSDEVTSSDFIAKLKNESSQTTSKVTRKFFVLSISHQNTGQLWG